MTARSLPNWARELVTLLPACAHFLLSGNIHDRYFMDAQPGSAGSSVSDTGLPRVLQSLPSLLVQAVRAEGISTAVLYNITQGAETLPRDHDGKERAEKVLGGRLDEVAPPGSLRGLADLIERVSKAAEPVALIIQSASRLVRDVAQLSDDEFTFYRRVDHLARNSRPSHSERPLFSPVVWILDNERDVPGWFSLRNEFLRSIVLPFPHTGEREELAARLVPTLGQADELQVSAATRVLAEQTAGMTLVAVERTVAIARDRGFGPDRIEDAARSYRVGVTDNPWRAKYLTDSLRQELVALGPQKTPEVPAPSVLASRVLGQKLAVRRALDILVRSAMGLTAAHASATATRPRGVLFFAGPTGVGKTELAKALTKLLFGDERFYVRFDMSEFRAEHSDQRLIGAPPGYTGYDAGGELTNAVRQRPFSLLLFDEIEKAHPKILDKFLQILDDGRLTDGRGDTVYFTESVVVFTSNLGIYEETEERDPKGTVVLRRRATVDRKKMTYVEMASEVERSIRDHFVLKLGRPELLNRMGDNIVVFDYINRDTGARILVLMLSNIIARVRQEHHIDLVVPPETVDKLTALCLSDDYLEFGGRGIGNMLETAVDNPLANALFIDQPEPGSRLALQIESREGEWTAHLLPV